MASFWEKLESDLSDFRDILYYTRPETKVEAIGSKSKKTDGKERYTSDAPTVLNSGDEILFPIIHEGIIPYSDDIAIEYIKGATRIGRSLFSQASAHIENKNMSEEFVSVWGKLSYICGRIESLWLYDSENIARLRGGKSNQENNIKSHLVWYSKMILLAKHHNIKPRKKIDAIINEEILFRQRSKNPGEFPAEWYDKFFNERGILTNAYSFKKLYKSKYEGHAENREGFSIPEVNFLSTTAIAGSVEPS